MNKFAIDMAYDSRIARLVEDRDPRAKATIAYLLQQKEDARAATDEFNGLANKLRQTSSTLKRMRVFQGVDDILITNPESKISFETYTNGVILIENELPVEYSRVLSVATQNGWNASIGSGQIGEDYSTLVVAQKGFTIPEFIERWYGKNKSEPTEVAIQAEKNNSEQRRVTIRIGQNIFRYKKLHGDIRDTFRVHRGDCVHPLGRIIG